MIIPFSFIKTPYVWDINAEAFLANMTDLSTPNKRGINQLILDLKANNLWSKLKLALISPPTISETEVFRDLKTNTIISSGKPNIVTLQSANNHATGFPVGYYLKQGTTTQFIDIGVSLATLGISVTSCCIMLGEKREHATAGHAFGAVQTASKRAFLRNESTITVGQMFKDSVSESTAHNVSGIWTFNRNAANYVEIVKDSTILKTVTTTETASTVPDINTYFGCSNTNGVAGAFTPGIKDFFAIFEGLSIAERALAVTIFDSYRTNMERPGTYTKNVVLDGNSLSVIGVGRMFRKAMLTANASNTGVYNIAVAGQGTATMLANYAANAAPLYDASLLKNVYVALEIGNDLYNAGPVSVATAKQNMIDLLAAAKATGYITVCMVPTARTYVGNSAGRSQTQFNLDLDTMVQWVRAGGSGADYIVDVTNPNLWLDRSAYASDAAYNTAIAALCANTTYFYDETHLTIVADDIRGVDLGNKLAEIL